MQKSRSVLLVDDEQAYHAIVRAIFGELDIAVDAVVDAPSAFQALRGSRYDMILMDIEMAGINGYRGAANIRFAAEWTRAVPIVAFTTLAPDDGEAFFGQRGFDSWLAKPFQATDLLQLARRIWDDPNIRVSDPAARRLAVILGEEQTFSIRERFFASLSKAISEIDAGSDPKPHAHRIGGLAGTLGMPALSAAWLELYRGRMMAWPTVRRLTIEVIRDADENNSYFPVAERSQQQP